MKHNWKRFTALILALSMCLSLLSATAWAADVETEAAIDEVVAGETLEAEEEATEESAGETEETVPVAAEGPEEEAVVSAAEEETGDAQVDPSAVDLSTCTVTVADATYTGSALTPAVTVADGEGNILTEDKDYTVSYSNNTNAGAATVTVTGIGDYTGTATAEFTISKARQTGTASAGSSSIYAGKTTTITASTTGDGTITYTSSDTSVATVTSGGKVTGKKPGTVKITVKAASSGNYKAASKTVKITVKLNKTTISSLTNTSKGVTVKWSKVTGASGYYIYRNDKQVKKITSGSTVSYTDTGAKTNGTKYQYKIYAYYGSTKSAASSAKTTYYVSRVSLSSLKSSAAKKMTVKWKKNAKASGYQIQYSTSSSFSSYETVSVSKASTVSRTISSLTGGKTYYVRVRAYKTVSGTKYYSAWSSKKSVKVKGSSSSSSSSSTVYITETGTKYHRDGCRYLSSSKISISRSKAVAQGYTACSVCNP
ncbi:MAG: Ig-like domain-containing protein [Clostridiales bacterium]|nr:Ig-like domain-containing protein [Clostridiales bacterium]